MDIGVIGFGIVGKSVNLGFKYHCNVLINDKDKTEDTPNSKDEIVRKCDFIFVGVPTPFNLKDKTVDASIISNVISSLSDLSVKHKKNPIVIIRSAIVPRLVRSWEACFPSLNIVKCRS